MRIFLPYPPSINKLWKPIARGKLVRSPAYRSWMNDAAWVVFLAAREQGKVKGPYALNVWLHPQSARRLRDVDNFLKAPCDALVKGGAVEDDSLCQDLRVRWGDFEDPGVLLDIEPCQRLSLPPDGSVKSLNDRRPKPARPTPRQRRPVATIQDAVIGEISATGKGVLKVSAKRRSSTSAGNIACPKPMKGPRT